MVFLGPANAKTFASCSHSDDIRPELLQKIRLNRVVHQHNTLVGATLMAELDRGSGAAGVNSNFPGKREAAPVQGPKDESPLHELGHLGAKNLPYPHLGIPSLYR